MIILVNSEIQATPRPHESPQSSKYNFIIINSDTFRSDLLDRKFMVKHGVYCSTPNIDRFSSNSMFFGKAYHASFPTLPNRLDLFTGRFTYTYYDWSPLPKNEVTLAYLLRKEGYKTMLVADAPHLLKDGYNFDRDFSGWVWIRGQENDRYKTDPENVILPCAPEKLRNIESTKQHIRNNYLRTFEEDWIPARTATEAVRWLEKNHWTPFYLFVDFFDPHEPWDAPEYYVEKYNPGYMGEKVIYPIYGPCDYLNSDELTHIRAMYAAEATLVDRWIGEILGKVESLGLLENTFIIFTSDHGFYLGEHGLVGKSIIVGEHHGLAPLYEEVCHIPLLIRPADSFRNVRKSERNDYLVQTPDITATVAELAGINNLRIQGQSLIPILSGENPENFRRIAVSTPSLTRGIRAGLRATITSDEWSLILAPQSDLAPLEEKGFTMIVDGSPRILKPYGKIETELYNLTEDPKQEDNVLKSNLGIARQLHQHFVQNLKALETADQIIEPWLKCKNI